MAQSIQDQKAVYPLAAYNYRVSVGADVLSCSEVSGLVIEYETVTYRHGLSYWEGQSIAKVHFDKYLPVTLKRGIVPKLAFLYDWLKSDEPRGMDISLCDETGEPSVTWHVAKALAVKLSAPTFQASGNEAAIESLELMVRGITIEHH